MGLDGKVDEAIRIIQGIIATDPDITDAYFSLGNILFPGSRDSRRPSTPSSRPSAASPTTPSRPSTSPWPTKAMGKFEEAEKFLLAYIEKGFADPQFYFMLGNMNYIQKKYDRAIAYFEKCLASNAESAGSHSLLGAIYIVKDDLARAEEHLAQGRRDQSPARQPPLLHGRAGREERAGRRRPRPNTCRSSRSRPSTSSPSTTWPASTASPATRRKELDYLNKCLETDPALPADLFLPGPDLPQPRRSDTRRPSTWSRRGSSSSPRRPSCLWAISSWPTSTTGIGDNALSEENARKGQAARRRRPRQIGPAQISNLRSIVVLLPSVVLVTTTVSV